MSAATAATAAFGTEPDARHVLEQGLRDVLGRGVRIAQLRSRKLSRYSSHPIWRLDVTLDDGERLPVIFKQLQPDPHGEGAAARERGAQRSVRREILLYQRLLTGGCFGAPLLYGSLCDAARGRYWLFLEDVGEWRIDWCEADDWEPAFRSMARMHAAYHGRADELTALCCLSQHDPDFYRGLASGARHSLSARAPSHVRARFDRLADRFLAPAVEYLGAQPRTFVHGDLSCHNVMVQRDRSGWRVRLIDWEWAAAGVGAWDVAKLLAGWGARKPRFLAAYLDEFGRRTTARLDHDAFRAAVTHCAVMQQLWYLRWWIEPLHDPAFVDRLLDKVEQRWQSLAETSA